MVFLVGRRQVGKTTLAKPLMPRYARAQYLNWDVANDRRIILGQTWSPRAWIPSATACLLRDGVLVAAVSVNGFCGDRRS